MSNGHLLILQVFILQAQSCSMSLFQDNFIMEEWFVFETERFINEKHNFTQNSYIFYAEVSRTNEAFKG